jgi:hypothetical protein
MADRYAFFFAFDGVLLVSVPVQNAQPQTFAYTFHSSNKTP